MCGSVCNFILFNVNINFFTTFLRFIVFCTTEAAHPIIISKRIEDLSSPVTRKSTSKILLFYFDLKLETSPTS